MGVLFSTAISATVGVTTLCAGAVQPWDRFGELWSDSERKTSERRRAAAYAVGEALGSAESLTDAAPAILESICENLDWHIAALWFVDHDARRLVSPSFDISSNFTAVRCAPTVRAGKGIDLHSGVAACRSRSHL